MADQGDAGAATMVVVDLEEDAPAAAARGEPGDGADVVEPAEGEADDTEGLPKHAVTLPDGRVRLPLLHPVTLRIKRGDQVREERFEAITFRRLTGADMRAISAAGKDGSIVTLQRSSDIAALKFDRLFDRMDGADVFAATQVVGFFLKPGPKTGR